MANTPLESAITQRLALEDNPRRFLTEPQNEGERLRFFSKKGFEMTLGPNANSFLKNIAIPHQGGLFSPPYTDEKVRIIKHQFTTWDRDLTGKEWKNTWQELKTQYKLTDEQVNSLQLEILSAYRFKVISQISISSQKKPTDKERNETIRIHDYLQTLNKSVRDKSLNRTRSATELYSHAQSSLKKNLEPSLAELTKAIKNKNYNAFGIEFENMRLSADKLGPLATKYIVDKLANDAEFLLALPRLIESSSSFKNMFLSHPEANTMLVKSIDVVKNSNYRHKHGIIDKMTGRKHTETQKGHIKLLEHLLKNQPVKSTKSVKVVPVAKRGHWLALRPSHELLQAEQPDPSTKPAIGRRKRPS